MRDLTAAGEPPGGLQPQPLPPLLLSGRLPAVAHTAKFSVPYSHRSQCPSSGAPHFRRKDIAAIEDPRSADHRPETARIKLAVLSPLGEMEYEICTFTGLLGPVTVVKFWNLEPSVINGSRVMNSDLGALGTDCLGYVERR
jgi:hypothetical protein